MSGTLLDFVKELNALCERDLLARVVSSSDVQWCLGELQDILEAEKPSEREGRAAGANRHHHERGGYQKWMKR